VYTRSSCMVTGLNSQADHWDRLTAAGQAGSCPFYRTSTSGARHPARWIAFCRRRCRTQRLFQGHARGVYRPVSRAPYLRWSTSGQGSDGRLRLAAYMYIKWIEGRRADGIQEEGIYMPDDADEAVRRKGAIVGLG
nr:hypothetical protein [Tanacetum cinerariifolium]